MLSEPMTPEKSFFRRHQFYLYIHPTHTLEFLNFNESPQQDFNHPERSKVGAWSASFRVASGAMDGLRAMAAQVSSQKKMRPELMQTLTVCWHWCVLGQVGHGQRLVAGFFIKTVLNEEGQGIHFYGVSNQQTLQMTCWRKSSSAGYQWMQSVHVCALHLQDRISLLQRLGEQV